MLSEYVIWERYGHVCDRINNLCFLSMSTLLPSVRSIWEISLESIGICRTSPWRACKYVFTRRNYLHFLWKVVLI